MRRQPVQERNAILVPARGIQRVGAERDWRFDTNLQGGLATRNNGRPTLGQFTAYSEAALSFGFKVDL